MKRILPTALLVFLAALSSTHATSVTFSAASARVVDNASATSVGNGIVVWVGTFTSTSFVFNPALSLATNISNIETSGGWNQFTLDTSSGQPDANITNTVTTGGLAGGGKISGTVTDNNSGSTKADYFDGKFLYVWVFNSSSVSTATQMGIFTAGSGANAPWVFPTNAGGLGDSVTLFTDSSDTPNMTALVGSTSSTTLNLVAAGVPEPSTLATLLGAGGLILMIRRRRGSK